MYASSKYPLLLEKFDDSMKRFQGNRGIQVLNVLNLSHWVVIGGVGAGLYGMQQMRGGGDGADEKKQRAIEKAVEEEMKKQMQKYVEPLLDYGNRVESLEAWRTTQSADTLETKWTAWNVNAAHIISAYSYSSDTMQRIELEVKKEISDLQDRLGVLEAGQSDGGK